MKPALLLSASILFPTFCPGAEPVVSSKPRGPVDPEAIRVQLIDYLRTHDTVLPPAPEIHPKRFMSNPEAVVPAQCYTLTEARHNPCYVCHQDPIEGRENVMGDGDLQRDYSFSDLGMTNHWQNLFEDRSERIAAIPDGEILAYIDEDNYSELPGRLREAGFEGWIPDLEDLQLGAGAFDEHGFAKDGSGWVAFNYKPLPSTFWPTNGSTDDVMIRLPGPYRSTADGTASLDAYRANLAILEATIKGRGAISCLPVDEARLFAIVDALEEVAGETGKSVPQVAINWLLRRPTVASVIIGARNEEQLQQNLGAVGWSLNGDQIDRLDAASAVA